MGYQQLTSGERYQIYGLLQAGFNQSEIGSKIQRDKSTISRELSRNRGNKGYRPKQADELSLSRREIQGRDRIIDDHTHDLIVIYLADKWSPEQISGYLAKYHSILICHETIYQFIRDNKSNGGELWKCLRQSSKKRRRKYGSKASGRGQIKDRVSIAKRPKVVDKKTRVGDWEGDSVVSSSNSSSLVTLVDRKSKITLVELVENREANTVESAVVRMLKPYKTISRTITFDNGKEFSNHKAMAKKLNVDIYFADPYSSWQRGLNENTNGLIRQYLPKKTDFKKVNKEEVLMIQTALNLRPRKTLNFMTPKDILNVK